MSGGDLNQRLDPLLDTSGRGVKKNVIPNKIRDMMGELGIMDVWRELNPTTKDYNYILMYNIDRIVRLGWLTYLIIVQFMQLWP